MGLPSVQYGFGTDVTIPNVDIPDHRVELSIEVGWLEVLRECLKIWISVKRMRCEQLVLSFVTQQPEEDTPAASLRTNVWTSCLWRYGGLVIVCVATKTGRSNIPSPSCVIRQDILAVVHIIFLC